MAARRAPRGGARGAALPLLCGLGLAAAQMVPVAPAAPELEAPPAAQPRVPPPQAGGVMEDLLHWAVQNSDPEKLKDIMRKYEASNLTMKDVYGQEVLDALFFDEYAFVRGLLATIADFRNASIPDENLTVALERVEEFAEQVDNAGNLHKMGGLEPLVDLGLDDAGEPTGRPPRVRARALLTLGVAVQNNEAVQADLLGLGVLRRMAARLPSCGGGRADIAVEPARAVAGGGGESEQVCGKLLYAMSGLVKNNATIQTVADDLGVFSWLVNVGASHASLPVAKKAMALLDTVLAQNPELPFLAKTSAEEQSKVAEALLAHVRGGDPWDVDAPEKALRLVARLLAVRPMLFPASFQGDLARAASSTAARCEASFGAGDELCENLASLSSRSIAMLAARQVRDDEL